MNDQPGLVTIAKSGAAVTAATGAQIADGAHSVASVVANFFVLTPANVASWLAAIFVFCQLWEWWWMRLWRPLLERWGWLAPKAKRARKASDSLRMEL